MLWRWAAILCRNISPPILETQDFFDSFRSCSFMKMHFPFDVQCTPEPHFFSIFHPGWLEVKQNVVKPLRKMMMGLWPLRIPTRPSIFTKELQSFFLKAHCIVVMMFLLLIQGKAHAKQKTQPLRSPWWYFIIYFLIVVHRAEHFCHLSPPAAAAANNIMKCIALHCLLGIAVGKLVVFVPSNYEAIACLAHAFQVPLAMH